MSAESVSPPGAFVKDGGGEITKGDNGGNLIKQYGKPSPLGCFQVDPMNETGTAAFEKEHDELLVIEVEIDYKSIKHSELANNGIELSPAELKAIIWLIKIESEEGSLSPDQLS